MQRHIGLNNRRAVVVHPLDRMPAGHVCIVMRGEARPKQIPASRLKILNGEETTFNQCGYGVGTEILVGDRKAVTVYPLADGLGKHKKYQQNIVHCKLAHIRKVQQIHTSSIKAIPKSEPEPMHDAAFLRRSHRLPLVDRPSVGYNGEVRNPGQEGQRPSELMASLIGRHVGLPDNVTEPEQWIDVGVIVGEADDCVTAQFTTKVGSRWGDIKIKRADLMNLLK